VEKVNVKATYIDVVKSPIIPGISGIPEITQRASKSHPARVSVSGLTFALLGNSLWLGKGVAATNIHLHSGAQPPIHFQSVQILFAVTMADDFLRLVSSANPAAQQHQPAMTHNGYPPSAGPYDQQPDPQFLDPFFDDDEDGPDSAFGRPPAMESRESGLPLSRTAAAPAGHSQVTLGDGVPQGWNFDDEDLGPSNQALFSGPAAFPGAKMQSPKSSASPKRKRWRWPWGKEKELIGERVIALNNSAANVEFSSNFISTSKYNMATFLPKFLFGRCISLPSPFAC
jgi:hypothetical protein